MKKIFVAVLAMAGVVACNTVDTLEVPQNPEIRFANAFVENATRADEALDPSTTTESLTAFDVWGFMDEPSGVVFEGEDVTGSKGNFSYVNTQYWAPGHTYYFAALAPMNSANWSLNTATADTTGAGVVTFTNVDGTEDLLYSAVSVAAPASITAAPEAVKFTFSHLLSKVKFTFVNGFTNDNATIDIKNIHITNAPAKASANLVGEWWTVNPWTLDGTETVDLAFGDACEKLAMGAKQECANERLTIPAAQDIVVTFDVALYMGSVLAYPAEEGKTHATLTVTVKDIALELGKAYNFTATLTAQNITEDGQELYPIVFDVEEVKDWVVAGTPDAQVKDAELRAAAQFGGEVVLTEDIALSTTLDVTKNLIIDLNGHNLTINNDSDELGEGDGIIVTEGTLTIKGEGTVTANTRAIWARGNGGAVINIEGGHYVGATKGNTCEVIYASGNGVINIYGGTFEAETEDNVSFAAPQYAVLNLHGNGATGCNITVYGGSFKNFNPADNISENPKKNFCAEGYVSVANGEWFDVIFVEQAVVATTAEEFAAAITANDKQINIVLNNNLDVAISSLGTITGGSGEYKLGGVDTEAITIDLNGKKLNITTTYWSNLGAKNDKAVFTIKNGTMTSSQATGTWNSYDLTFSNCDYIFEDVVFEKAIAFDNTGKSASLKDVTIKESHDYYAMWITADGQNITVDNLTIESAGRGIKIDEQYRDTPAKVTLTVKNSKFTTAKKAAIMVKSAAGAQINVENLDITNVDADSVNAVWVDSDSAAYYDLVTVTGGSKTQE